VVSFVSLFLLKVSTVPFCPKIPCISGLAIDCAKNFNQKAEPLLDSNRSTNLSQGVILEPFLSKEDGMISKIINIPIRNHLLGGHWPLPFFGPPVEKI
jgi:hypothetical protein